LGRHVRGQIAGAGRARAVKDAEGQDGEDERQESYREKHEPVLKDLRPFFPDDGVYLVHSVSD
jgi:hypothetical protein